MQNLPEYSDVVVVGAGNAALCAALSAAERGVSVLVLERAPEDESGGNTRFTAGAIKCVYYKDGYKAGRTDRKANLSNAYERQDGKYDSRNASHFQAGYEAGWAGQ